MPAFLSRPLRLVVLVVATSVGLVAAPQPQPPQASAAMLTLGQRAVIVASQQQGKPYRYGAAGPYAFDCSGFTQYVYRRLGHLLAHNTVRQYWETRHLSRASMRPGDLLFFTSNGRPSGIDHVTVYAGGRYMWAARHTGTVVQKQWIYSNDYLVGRVRG